MVKSLILISDNTELCKSLKRVLDLENIIPVRTHNNLRDYIKNDRDIILYFAKNRNELYTLLWENIRIRGNLTNPFVAIGFHRIATTDDFRDMVFEKKEPKRYHRYIQVSENIITELEECFRVLIPIYEFLDALTATYCDWKGILHLILTHDLPNALRAGSKDKVLALLARLVNVLSHLKQFDDILCTVTALRKEIEGADLDSHYDNFIKQIENLWEVLNGRISNVYR